jgi:probable F420-dependent oxidoreductase
MKIGIAGPGFAKAATLGAVRGAARTAERVGFSTVWFGEHIVLFEGEAEEHYPDKTSDRQAHRNMLDPRTPLADPIVAMTWAAAVTERIEIGTNVMILPQRNPLVLAKELSTLDGFCGGRIALGAGSGWSPTEYAAVNADWKGRGRRMDEYVEVMRALWREEAATYGGETIRFRRAYMEPKPGRDIPILFGGEGEAVRRRVARMGDGWIPVLMPLEEAPQILAELRRWTQEAGRDPDALRIVKSITLREDLDNLPRFRDAGVTEFKLSCYGELPGDEAEMTRTLEALGETYVGYVAGL